MNYGSGFWSAGGPLLPTLDGYEKFERGSALFERRGGGVAEGDRFKGGT